MNKLNSKFEMGNDILKKLSCSTKYMRIFSNLFHRVALPQAYVQSVNVITGISWYLGTQEHTKRKLSTRNYTTLVFVTYEFTNF